MIRTLLCATVLLGLSCPAAAIDIWLSASDSMASESLPPSDPSSVETIIHAPLDSSGTLFVWARPDAGKTLQNWSLRLLTANPDVLTLVSSSVEAYNPILGNTGSPGFQDIVRWEHIGEPTGDPSGATAMIGDMQGFSLLQDTRLGMGIGPVCGGSDPFCNTSSNVWLLAQIDYTVGGNLGQTGIFMQIGEPGINNQGESSSDTSVVLGALTDVALNGNDNRLVNSVTADAFILVADADMDADGDTDGSDFLAWQRGFGITGGALRSQGDATGDGAVDRTDLDAWQSQLGKDSSAVSNPSSISVPEPGTLSIVCMVFVGSFVLVHAFGLGGNHPVP